MMTRIIFGIALLIAVVMNSYQAFAGTPTSAIVINGPGISREGIEISLESKTNFLEGPGSLSFIRNEGKIVFASRPTSDLPVYVLAFYVKNRGIYTQLAYTVLYVWDHHSERGFVYLPSSLDMGYRVNFSYSVPEYEGKWVHASKRLDDMIRNYLPKLPDNNKE